MAESKKQLASHRTSRLRKVQDVLAPKIPGILTWFDEKGIFPGTKIHDAVVAKRDIHADDITLTQLQMTAHIADVIENNTFYPQLARDYIVTSFLNGADGPVARQMHTESNEGGIKDASVDRLSETMVANLLAKELELPEQFVHDLQVSFQLSTLTKAACEMVGVKTKEGGMGSMIQRRKTLFFILQDLVNRKKIPSQLEVARERSKRGIVKRLEKLMHEGQMRAKERMEKLRKWTGYVFAPSDEDSAGASEARKYAGIVRMSNRMGIDIVAELNALAENRVEFPTDQKLAEEHAYIADTLEKSNAFLTEALQIAGYEK
jgi:hypothetical protein